MLASGDMEKVEICESTPRIIEISHEINSRMNDYNNAMLQAKWASGEIESLRSEFMRLTGLK